MSPKCSIHRHSLRKSCAFVVAVVLDTVLFPGAAWTLRVLLGTAEIQAIHPRRARQLVEQL